MTRKATPAQLARARDVAWAAMQLPVNTSAWPSIVEGFQTLDEVEAFRVTLLLEGRDTRSARRAIQARKDVIAGLRLSVRGGGYRAAREGQPFPARKPRGGPST